MEFREIIRKRCSCRKFDGRPVEREALAAILEAGRLAPTAKNLQEQHIYVIESAEGLAKVDSITPCRYGASTVIAVAFDRRNVFTYPGGKHDSGAEDAAIVATHIMLAAEDEGIASCWVNFFDPDEAVKALGLPDNESLLMLLDLGYAVGKPSSAEKGRKPLAETVSYL